MPSVNVREAAVIVSIPPTPSRKEMLSLRRIGRCNQFFSSKNVPSIRNWKFSPLLLDGYFTSNQFNLVLSVHFSRIRKGSKRVERTSKSSDNQMTTTPPPAAPVNIEECWVEVQDKASGQMYWWNTATNETTALGAPKPTGASAVGYPQQQSDGMMRGLGSVVAEGFAFGAGSAVAHNVVGSFFGGGGHHHDSSSGGESSGGDDSWDI